MASAAERVAKEKRRRLAAGPQTVVCRIRQKRDQFGLSLREVAESIGGVTHEVVRKWEQGRFMPSLPNAYKVARFFACSVYDIWPDVPAEKGK